MSIKSKQLKARFWLLKNRIDYIIIENILWELDQK